MAQLDQLQFSGIRGFRPYSKDGKIQEIKFVSPLTLVLGQNGCGKTTIIEAINYACCGEVLSTNREFQDFINRPELSDLFTHRGTIKLQILDQGGKKIKIDQKLEVNSHPKLDHPKIKKSQTLTIVDTHGEISTYTDTKKLNQIMKISPILLNNIIFCHQENSTWPLTDENKLKEIFDDIFKLEKYSESLRELKQIQTKKKRSIEVLKEKLSSFNVDLKEDLQWNKNNVELITSIVEETQNKLLALHQEKSQFLEKCVERNKLIRRIKEEMKIKMSNNYEDPKKDLEELKDVLEYWQNDLNIWIGETKNAELEQQKKLDHLQVEKNRIEASIQAKKQEMGEHVDKMAEISETVTDLLLCEAQYKDYSNEVEEIDGLVKTAKQNESEEKIKMENNHKSILETEFIITVRKEELKILQDNETIQNNIKQETEFMEEKLNEIRKIATKHYDHLKQLFNDEVPERNVVGAAVSLAGKAELALKTLTQKIEKAQSDVLVQQTNCYHQMTLLSSCENEAKKKEEEIFNFCNGQSLVDALNISYRNKENLQQVKGQYETMKTVFEKYVNEFEKANPCCPICDTNIMQRNVGRIVENLKKKIEEIPRKLAVVESDLLKETNRYNKLQQLITVETDVEHIRLVILPKLTLQLQQGQQTLNDCNTNLKKLKLELDPHQRILEITKSIIPDMAILDQNQSIVEKSQKNIENLKKKLVNFSTAKSVKDIQEEIKVLKDTLTEMKTELERQSQRISDYNKKHEQLINERKRLENELARLKKQIEEKTFVQTEQKEGKTRIEFFKKEILELNAILNENEEKLKKAGEKKEELIKMNNVQIQKERKTFCTFQTAIQDLEMLQNQIEDYIKKEKDVEISQLDKKLKDYEKKREEAVKENIEQKAENTFLKVDLNPAGSATIIEDDMKDISDMKEISLNKLKSELMSPSSSREAFDNYMVTFYQLKTKENLLLDLQKSIGALEQAMRDFRNQKLKQINANIKNLWRSIYKGNDIDYIKIVYKTKKKEKSYIYKIVQIRNGQELDMRRTCSTSQKLLASLVIRLALAETLGLNCGIFAIDEPTMNLDRENMQSLCDTLSDIIREKVKREKHFRFLVVTHDEEFLNALIKTQDVTNYYCVARDTEGFSVIEEILL